ncbi:hypothetical protein [Halostagnicola kamekurae]|uniref:hypothetical protein n=1 Tax=Halostagnicola kamekurae TaxID=619731 RepID=UPI0015878023|nr:hypothetical protein [Halostagnicola kamekurae]
MYGRKPTRGVVPNVTRPKALAGVLAPVGPDARDLLEDDVRAPSASVRQSARPMRSAPPITMAVGS